MFLLEQKNNKEPLKFDTVNDMFNYFEEKRKNRTMIEKIWDFINYRIVWKYIHPLHPSRLKWKIKNIIQKKMCGFNDYEIMDLDGEFAKWIIPKLKEINSNHSSIKKMIRAFELVNNMDEELHKDNSFNIDKYKIESANLNKELYDGLKIFFDYLKSNLNLEVEVCNWMLPRLKKFMINNQKYPSYPSGCVGNNGEFIINETMSHDEWQAILNDMITAFEFILFKYNSTSDELNNSSYIKHVDKEINKGIELFTRYFTALWL